MSLKQQREAGRMGCPVALGTWRRRCSVRPGLQGQQSFSWLKCLFSQSVCDREAFRRGCRVPTQGLVRGLSVVSYASPRPGSPPLPGKWEKCVRGPEHQARPCRHQDVTGTAFPGGACAGQAPADAKGWTRPVVQWLLGFVD